MYDNKKIVGINPTNPEPEKILQAGKILARKGIVIFPAKCLYGIAVNALKQEAVKKVFSLKQRPLDNPILLLVKDRAMLQSLVTHTPLQAEKLMDAFWPGNLTIVFNAKDHILEQLTAGTGKIGIRVPVHPVAKAIVNAVDFPITGTSANLSGNKGCTRTHQLAPPIIDNSDLVLDAGSLKGGIGSTIVDVTHDPVRILRQGEISTKQIQKLLQ